MLTMPLSVYAIRALARFSELGPTVGSMFSGLLTTDARKAPSTGVSFETSLWK